MALQTNLYAHLSTPAAAPPYGPNANATTSASASTGGRDWTDVDDGGGGGGDQSPLGARPCPYRLDRHYRALLVEDFQEEYPRLPAEANPLDPRLADPAAFARAAPGQGLGQGQGGHRRGGNLMQPGGGGRRRGGDLAQDPLAMLQALAMQQDDEGMGMDLNGMGGMDMEALLAQLGPQLDPQNREAILQALMDLQGGGEMMPMVHEG